LGGAIPGFSSITQIPDVAPATGASGAPEAGNGQDFGKTLDGMLEDVSNMQSDAQNQVTELLQGNGQDVHSAMIAVEKADLSFQLMMQVRNKIVQAYQTISQMPF
jgi:flagellar hook-basal body complex protein FliE